MKSEVYSWRVSRSLKEELEAEARETGLSLAGLLQQISEEWLETRRRERALREREIRDSAARYVGSIAGGDPDRSEQVGQRVRERLADRSESPG